MRSAKTAAWRRGLAQDIVPYRQALARPDNLILYHGMTDLIIQMIGQPGAMIPPGIVVFLAFEEAERDAKRMAKALGGVPIVAEIHFPLSAFGFDDAMITDMVNHLRKDKSFVTVAPIPSEYIHKAWHVESPDLPTAERPKALPPPPEVVAQASTKMRTLWYPIPEDEALDFVLAGEIPAYSAVVDGRDEAIRAAYEGLGIIVELTIPESLITEHSRGVDRWYKSEHMKVLLEAMNRGMSMKEANELAAQAPAIMFQSLIAEIGIGAASLEVCGLAVTTEPIHKPMFGDPERVY